MKPKTALAALLVSFSGSPALAQQIIQATPGGVANTDIYALHEPGISSGRDGLQFYYGGDKEHVFNISPSAIGDPSTSSGEGYQGALSPGQQSSVGIQFGLPLFGSPEAAARSDRVGNNPENNSVWDEFPHGHNGP